MSKDRPAARAKNPATACSSTWLSICNCTCVFVCVHTHMCVFLVQEMRLGVQANLFLAFATKSLLLCYKSSASIASRQQKPWAHVCASSRATAVNAALESASMFCLSSTTGKCGNGKEVKMEAIAGKSGGAGEIGRAHV